MKVVAQLGAESLVGVLAKALLESPRTHDQGNMRPVGCGVLDYGKVSLWVVAHRSQGLQWVFIDHKPFRAQINFSRDSFLV